MREFTNLKQLIHTFRTESQCRNYLAQLRWNSAPVCPHCAHTRAYVIEGGKRYKCANKECHKRFSVLTGTVFENSNVPLSTWFPALYLIASHKKGISSCQLARDLGVTQKTAWFMLHRIREALRNGDSGLLTGVVQVDETYMGGKEQNKHASKRIGKDKTKGRSTLTKTPVVGVHDGKNTRMEVVPFVSRKVLEKVIFKNVNTASTLVTDTFATYKNIGKRFYKHIQLNHRKDQYTLNGFHTNGVENTWSLLKRGIYGIYHQVSPWHLQRYCDEFTYRFNSRKEKDSHRFELILRRLDGRLKYKTLIYGEEKEQQVRREVENKGQFQRPAQSTGDTGQETSSEPGADG